MLDPSETIVAISSHPGPAARGIVRLSGPGAIAIALEGFEGDVSFPSRPTTREGSIRLGALGAVASHPHAPPPRPSPTRGEGVNRDPASEPSTLVGEDRVGGGQGLAEGVRLPATLLLWPGPRSYTGQPVAEIHTVGSPPILEHLVARALAGGARLAERGEFTLRAFLAGRIDLAQSEAVLRVIEARSSAQLDAALRQLAGGLAGPAREVRDRLLDRLVELEANLDFVDESDIPPVVLRGLIDELTSSARRLDDLLGRLRTRDRADVRPRVVLAGAPNAGKSRLFNALLGDDRAIVAPVAGTTRDDLAASLDCAGLLVELVDTAGEEEASSPISASAQARRAARLAEADLTLDCIPASELGGAVLSEIARRLTVATKVDLAPGAVPPTVIATSAATGEGLEAVRSAIAARLCVSSEDAPAIGAESAEALSRAIESVGHALRLASGGGPEELIAAEVRQAVDDLGKIVGAVVSEDILDRIFRRFCVGK